MDAALYEYNPPRVSTLYGITVPRGDHQIVRYDDGSGDELSVPLATTAFVSGKTTFELLPPELKSLAVRTSVRYAPHPFVWMASACALPTGLGIENDGLECPTAELPDWEESKIKTFPVVSQSIGQWSLLNGHFYGSCGRTLSRETSTFRFTHVALRNSSSSPSQQARNATAPYTQMAHTSRILPKSARCFTRCNDPPLRRK